MKIIIFIELRFLSQITTKLKGGIKLVIYGVALLGFCMLVGMFLGEVLGIILQVDANVGGVGISMLMFVIIMDHLQKKGKIKKPTGNGITFWSAMFIPIVVAMAAQQNVYGAISGGPMAILAGAFAVILSFILIRYLNNIGKNKDS